MSDLEYAIGKMASAIEHYDKADTRGEWYGLDHGHVRLYAGLQALSRAAEGCE